MSCIGIPVVEIVEGKAVCPYCKKELEGAEDFEAMKLSMTCSHCGKEVKPSKST